MKVKLKSKEIVKILRERDKINIKIGKQQEELVALDKDHRKLGHKVKRIIEKGLNILDKVIQEQYKMKEFEYSGQMAVLDDEVFEIEIHDMFSNIFNDPEKVKQELREAKEKKGGVYADPLMLTGHKK